MASTNALSYAAPATRAKLPALLRSKAASLQPGAVAVVVVAVGKWSTALTLAVVHLSTTPPGATATVDCYLRPRQTDIFAEQLADIIPEQ
jgi:hypothetical protein